MQYGIIPEKEKALAILTDQLNSAQGTSAMLKEEVNAEDIAEIVAKWTGIPVQKMLQSEREKLLLLETELGKRVAGQHEAIAAVSDAVWRNQQHAFCLHRNRRVSASLLQHCISITGAVGSLWCHFVWRYRGAKAATITWSCKR